MGSKWGANGVPQIYRKPPKTVKVLTEMLLGETIGAASENRQKMVIWGAPRNLENVNIATEGHQITLF